MSLTEKILEAKEKFGGTKAALLLADAYKMENFDETTLSACCPFHKDDTPSFHWFEKKFEYKCFGCGKRLSILDYYIETEGTFKAALNRLFSETEVSFNISSINRDKDKEKDIFKNYKFPKEETNTNRERVNEYSAKRGISEETLDWAGVKQDDKGNIVFELRDMDNRLVSKKMRVAKAIASKKSLKWFWEPGTDTYPLLYNMSKVDMSAPLVITEGFYDALAVIEAGYKNVVSIPGGATDDGWIESNFDFLKNFEEIILWFDNDPSGEVGKEKAVKRLGEYRCKIATPTDEHKAAVEKYYVDRGAKSTDKCDANNVLVACGAKEVVNIIENAEDIPADDLMFLMDARPTNLKDAEKFSTGIAAFDNLGYGTIVPSFEIYTGYTGSGKTSLANLTGVLAAVEQGYNAFVFSGELGPGMLSDWITAPLAGYNHMMKTYDPKFKKPFYSVTPEALEAIRSFYKRHIIAYNDRKALSADGAHLIERMEYAYKKYNCRSFLVDNLMCLSFENLNDDSEWKTQKRFIINLMGFAERFGVTVKLIVHPKKPSPHQKVQTAYDLHGASEIANLCHRMYWVKKHNPDADDFDGYNVTVESIKDRLAGSQGSCKLFYCGMTKRIYSTLDELRFSYSWESGFSPKYSAEVKKKLILDSFPRFLPNEDTNQTPY